jgi:hypothetical protein
LLTHDSKGTRVARLSKFGGPGAEHERHTNPKALRADEPLRPRGSHQSSVLDLSFTLAKSRSCATDEAFALASLVIEGRLTQIREQQLVQHS